MTKRKTGKATKQAPPAPKARIIKSYRTSPAIRITAALEAIVRAGTHFAGARFRNDTIIAPPAEGYVAGTDYAVHIVRGKPTAKVLISAKLSPNVLGGFHVAPGTNAPGVTHPCTGAAEATPAINPLSAWDRDFRPACKDPRGMTRVETPTGWFWCDIYLLAQDHLGHGTSRFGVTIGDGVSLPEDPRGGRFQRFDFAAATAVMKHHGKQLLTVEEFFAAALGVTERSAAGEDPRVTGCDAPRTSSCGLMQATGNMWVWGTDGHPVDPRPSFFGGSWFGGSNAGSRYATLGCWPGLSNGGLGARGRSDHLQLG